MGKHLTDKQKKMIIADYVDCGNYSAVSRKYQVDRNTVKRIVIEDTETTKKVQQKKEQNTADVLEFMNGKKEDVCDIITLYLGALKNEDKLSKTSIQSIAISLGIIIDKFTASDRNDQALQKLDEMLNDIGGVI